MKRVQFDFSKMHLFPIVAPDTETSGLHWYRDEMFGVAIACYDPREQVMMSGYWDIRENPRIIGIMNDEFKRCQRIVNHNMKFDALMMGEKGIHLPHDKLECTSVRAALINEWEPSFGLDSLGKKYLGVGKHVDIWPKLAALFGGAPTLAAQIKNLPRAPASLVAEYAIPDAEIAAQLWAWQEDEIDKQDLRTVWDLERRLMPVLLDIEHRGVRVDIGATEKALVESRTLTAANQQKLDKAAGREVNPNSPKQMRELFKVEKGADGKWRSGGVILEETDGGNPSLDADALRTLDARGHEMAGLVLGLRKAIKAQSFLKDHILGHQINGRVYPNYNQTRGDNDLGTGTGRFSINDPALQQIPARDVDIASIVRACFIPGDGNVWTCADWEQFEFRWFAHYTKDPNILRAYQEDPRTDFHQIVSDMTGIPRKPRFAGDPNAKQINLGMVFGMGEGRLAEEMGLPYTVNDRGYLDAGPEAKEVFTTYHSRIPGVRALLDEARSIARSRGYVKTALGRHLRFPGGKYTHKAGGLVFQGTSAECMKVKMIEMHDISKKQGFDMLLSVHDELDFDIPKEIRDESNAIIKSTLQNFNAGECEIVCRIPILSSVESGPNWWVASK